MAMSSGGGSGRAPLSEINVTPLVDVMLVLLVIFMVTAPLMSAGVEVDLPQADAPEMQLEEEKLLLLIDAEQHIWLRVIGTASGDDERIEIPYEFLLERLSNNARIRDTHALYVQADMHVSYGFVAQVLAIARQAGVEELGLVTDPRGEGPPTPAMPVPAPAGATP
ncbi:MAG: biopolymer transporter ExbD [Sandaracinaceae bacterium]